MRPKGLLFADQVPAALGADAGSHGHSRVNAQLSGCANRPRGQVVGDGLRA
jgi:hypothetical protein